MRAGLIMSWLLSGCVTDAAPPSAIQPEVPPRRESSGGKADGVDDESVVQLAGERTECTQAIATSFSLDGLDDAVARDELIWHLRGLDFDPAHCMWDSIRSGVAREVGGSEVIGVSFGYVVGVSVEVASYSRGYELVMIAHPSIPDAAMVGVVGYRGYGASLSLPGGGSVTQGVIHGSCAGGIDGYLGWFATATVGLNSYNAGRDGWDSWNATGCDSWSITRGTTSELLGITRSYYWSVGPFVAVAGPQVDPFLRWLDDANGRVPVAAPPPAASCDQRDQDGCCLSDPRGFAPSIGCEQGNYECQSGLWYCSEAEGGWQSTCPCTSPRTGADDPWGQ